MSDDDEQPVTLADAIRKKITASQGDAPTPPETQSYKTSHVEGSDPKASWISQRARAIGEQICRESSMHTPDGSRYATITARIQELVEKTAGPFTAAERGVLLEGVRDEVFGFGPIGVLLRDPTIDRVYVNGFSQVYVERQGSQEKTNVSFEDEKHLASTIEKILQPLRLRLDENNPMVSARLPNGSIVEICGPPLSIDGPTVFINCSVSKVISLGLMLTAGMITEEMIELLKGYVENRANIIVSGFKDSSQNSLVCALSAHISPNERIISVESFATLRLLQEHWIRFETLKSNLNSDSGNSMRSLVAKALRMKPDRLILGECCGEEAYELIQAYNTGTTGSITIVNAASTSDCIRRLEHMISLGEPRMTRDHAFDLIANGIQVIIQMQRFADGTCRVTEIAEVTGVKGDQIETTIKARLGAVSSEEI